MHSDAVGRSGLRPRGLSIAVHRDHGVLRVAARGELDLASAPQLEEQLRTAGDAEAVVIDLAGLEFMDCSGLRVLLAARERHGGTVLLSGLTPQVRRLMTLTGTTEAFSFTSLNGVSATVQRQAHAA